MATRDERLRVFVGDVHGCADELDDLLAALSYDPAAHDLWFVGDLVNRGPESLRAVRRVRQLGAGCVVGNHDLHALARWRGVRGAKRLDTLGELLAAPDAAELMGWLASLPALALWPDVVLVHAGLHPHWRDPEAVAREARAGLDGARDPFANETLAYLTTVRHCDASGHRPAPGTSAPGPPFAPWDAFYTGSRTVVFGHWAQRGLVVGDRTRGLDTRCVWGGRLTAWIAEQDRLVSVPARERYQEPGAAD